MSQGNDTASEVGDDYYRTPIAAAQISDVPGMGGAQASSGAFGLGPGVKAKKGATAVETADVSVGQGWGRGPMKIDARKFRFDVRRGKSYPAIAFSASKADRMDAAEAGELLNRIHVVFGIEKEREDRILAFNNALFLEHALNGASLLQPGRGTLKAGDTLFDVQMIKGILGVDQRRFFRAFADEIADVVREILREYDPMDPESAEVHGQLSQIAVERGLTKFPYLVHDSADAGINLSNDERNALIASKRFVLRSTVNNVDKIPTHDDARMEYETGITT